MIVPLFAIAISGHKPKPPTLPGYKLVWHDEFDKDGLPDPAKWNYETGFVRNREPQLYTRKNAVVKNGFLIIEGRHEEVPNPGYQADAPAEDWQHSRPTAAYTSASLTTAGKRVWTYGRFECRGRFAITEGMWPAFWMTGPTRAWPANGEIDIMEFYQHTYLANVAWGSATPGGIWRATHTPIANLAKLEGYPSADAWSQDFHTYRMDWDSDHIRLYVDDHLLNDLDLAKTINESPDHANPFHEPHHLILNLAIGATGGNPEKTTWPTQFKVDWVRVYQRKGR